MRSAAVVVACNHAGNDAGKENHKRIDHALYQGQRNHVAVADVRHFVRQNGFDFVPRHALEQTRTHRNQRTVARGTGCESIGFGGMVDRHFRRFQAPLPRLCFHSRQQPRFHLIARLHDDFRTDRVFRDGFGHQ